MYTLNSDGIKTNDPIRSLEVSNTYQHGLNTTNLSIQKFDLWGIPIPREDNTLNRMRSSLLNIKISLPEKVNTVVENITINYTE